STWSEAKTLQHHFRRSPPRTDEGNAHVKKRRKRRHGSTLRGMKIGATDVNA
ncbi:hypothetical protein V5799_025754, partial [Amblyomma americanum]